MSFMYDDSMSDSFRVIFGLPGLSERRANHVDKEYFKCTSIYFFLVANNEQQCTC